MKSSAARPVINAWEKTQELFGIDLRSLAAFRICLACVVLFDLAVRSMDLTTFYTDSGVLSRAALLRGLYNPGMVSLHMISGTVFVQVILFLVAGLCSVSLFAGWRTRLMTVLCWFLTISVQRRNPMILGGGDDYLRVMLFWSMFVPLGARFSVDSALDPTPLTERPLRFLSWGTAALLLQAAVIYPLTAIQKWPGVVWHNGTAVYYALNIDSYVSKFGHALLLFPSFLKCLTHTILWFEIIGPVLLFFPVFTTPIRILAILGFIFMHMNFYLSMGLRLFPEVGALAMVAFIPSAFWDYWLPALRTHFPSMDRSELRQTATRWVKPLKQAIATQPLHPIHLTEPPWVSACIIFFFALTAWRCLSLSTPLRVRTPALLNDLTTFIYTDQRWNLFAPEPFLSSGWYLIPGRLKDGSVVDLFEGGAPLSWAKPASIPATFKNERWRKFLINLGDKRYPGMWGGYEDYLCRSWNNGHEASQQLQFFDIVYMVRATPPDAGVSVYREKILSSYHCATQNQSTVWRKT